MKKLFWLFIILISALGGLCLPCYGQDQIVNARNNYVQISLPSTAWSTLASQTYVFTPLSPDHSLCLSMVNNNTTSTHSFNLNIFTTGDNNTPDYTHNTGRYTPITPVGLPNIISSNSSIYFYVPSKSAAKVALVFTGGNTQAGSPDTVDIFAVQTTNTSCGTIPPQATITESYGTQFLSQQSFINPTINLGLLSVNSNNTTQKTIFFNKVVVSTTVNITIFVQPIQNAGSTCTAVGPFPLKLGNIQFPSTIAVSNFGCASPPTFAVGAIPATYSIPANSSLTIDLTGYQVVGVSNSGLTVASTASVTGTVWVTFFWTEK